MNVKKEITRWKYACILLFGIGISNIGEWVYFIALNLIVLDMTDSPLAVSVLYIIKPLATLFTSFWAGSFIDRLNKRSLMIFLDIIRALFIVLLPLLSSVPSIYLFVFIINMASAMFSPVSLIYITKLILQGDRKRFNALYSLVTSGAFFIGPAVAGLLFYIGTPTLAIYINAVALFSSGLITYFMPNLENNYGTMQEKISFKILRKDWNVVMDFSREHKYTMWIYVLFSCVMVVMASAVDSLEAAFAKKVLLLSNSEYGILVSIAGAGIVLGACINTLFIKKIAVSLLIGLGSVLVSFGYVIYAISTTFLFAGIGFFILAFFISYANAGFLTFYQNNIPTDVMGRVGSIYRLFEAMLIIFTTTIIGTLAQMISIRIAVIAGVFVMLLLAFTLLIASRLPSKKRCFNVL
ncbi:MFS transporter [Virgibacillus dokdonensis]|uniref:MFS transporter n=1 Tax=Virgibacillus dokdonensis TaxID=302167 RepID=A0A3E0WKP6_9BACI|nr:MFS transporter [Virgibacillus dokdonensis]RFA32979.1 MFS transporter [Virgibacillus dokdonensis]